jgi:hypothetical protein
MTSGHEDTHGGLPPALARAQDDLAAYIRERVSPETTLLKIMEASERETIRPLTFQPIQQAALTSRAHLPSSAPAKSSVIKPAA